MKLVNCDIFSVEKYITDKRVYFFGAGAYLYDYVEKGVLEKYKDKIDAIIDSFSEEKEISLWGKSFPVVRPDVISGKKNICVFITSNFHMMSIFQKLRELDLDESVNCFAYPFCLINVQSDDFEFKRYRDIGDIIPKIIHCCWFSGEDKPDLYKRCIDSWHKYCGDYEIKEWNLNNVDVKKYRFMEKAIECRKWAFASDIVRLDVVNRFGGVYLDMDVEVLQPMNILLGFKSFFSFDHNTNLELAVFGSHRGNKWLSMILDHYKTVEFEETQYLRFAQPAFLRSIFKELGVKHNGKCQIVDDNLILSRKYLCPMDGIIYSEDQITDQSIAVHRINSGWLSEDKMNRIRQNKELYEMFSMAM